MKEHLRRGLYQIILAFFLYFAFNILPFFLVQDNFFRNDLLEFTKTFANPITVCLSLVIPLVVAATSQSFLHQEVKALSICAQPFSRRKIYASHILSGWIISTLPVVATFFLFILVPDVTLAIALSWVIRGLILTTFFYGLFLLSGSLVGTTVKQILLDGVFLVIVPAIYALFVSYCNMFLKGFPSFPEKLTDIIMHTNPIGGLLYEGCITKGWLVIYMLAGILFALLGCFLYEHARLEKIGDSILFRYFEDCLTWAVSFVGMCIIGIIFHEFVPTVISTILGMLIGLTVSFFVMKLIIEKTPHIFHRKNALSAAGFFVVFILFSALTVFDATGYGKRLPDIDKVEYVEIYQGAFLYDIYYGQKNALTLSDSENISEVIRLHQIFTSEETYFPAYTTMVTYHFKNGSCMERMITYNEEEAALFGSNLDANKELKNYRDIEAQLGRSNVYSMEITSDRERMDISAVAIADQKLVSSVLSTLSKEKVSDTSVSGHEYGQMQTGFGVSFYDKKGNLLASVDVNKQDEQTLKLLVEILEEDGYVPVTE